MPVIDAGLVVVAASTVRSVGLVIAVAVALAVGLYAFVNFRQGPDVFVGIPANCVIIPLISRHRSAQCYSPGECL